MGLSGAERQARWRAKRDKEIEQLRRAAEGKAAPDNSPTVRKLIGELTEARKEIARLRQQSDTATKAAQVDVAESRALVRREDMAADRMPALLLDSGEHPATGMHWYGGKYIIGDYDCFYSDPSCGDDCYCIEPPPSPKERGGFTYIVRDRNDEVIDEAYTLVEAMEIAQEHADGNPSSVT